MIAKPLKIKCLIMKNKTRAYFFSKIRWVASYDMDPRKKR